MNQSKEVRILSDKLNYSKEPRVVKGDNGDVTKPFYSKEPYVVIGDSGGGPIGDIPDGSITTEKLAPDAKAPYAGEADEADSVPWTGVTEKPTEYKPEAHTHQISQVDGLQADLNKKVIKAGDTMTGPLLFADPNNRSKLILTKYTGGTGHKDAPTTLDLNSIYLHLGGTEYAQNSYRLIGFGYRRYLDTSHASVVAGSQEIDTDGADMSDFIVGTRNTHNDEAPTIRFRITHDGQIMADEDSYSPASDKALTNKKYVDGVVSSLLADVEPIADPTTATAEDIANKVNEILTALKG